MLIWLGKQRLGQRDRQEIVADASLTVTVMHYGSNLAPQTWPEIQHLQTKKGVDCKN
jgi:hypothetical protein